MKNHRILLLIAILFGGFSFNAHGQAFGPSASAIWMTDCIQSNFYNTSGAPAHFIGPAANQFNNKNFGVHSQGSGTLIFRGAQVKTFRDPATANVCGVEMHYRIYAATGVPGSFNTIALTDMENCNVGAGQFPSGGTCVPGDQKWQLVIADGTTTPYEPIDLTSYAAGNYVLEVYYTTIGSSASTTACDETVLLNNGGANYKANFTIQSPLLVSNNPSTCNGSQGSITINGLAPGVSYQLSYTDDGVDVGPNASVANGAGQVIVTGLNAGLYSDFLLEANGCATNLATGIILSNPIFVPKFNPIAAFCAGTPAPTLPTTSTNGITGTWSPAVIDNQNTGNYTFTPSVGQCGISVTVRVNVTPRTIPTFTFGTSASICRNGAVPVLPNFSSNGVSGSWTPAVVDNRNSGTYTFTPSTGQCATNATFTVTVSPNITPAFDFGSSLVVCAGDMVPALPTVSANGISGSWTPAVIDNLNSRSYTFNPAGGQCATTANLLVTVNPIATPTFSFGTNMAVCAGSTVPALPATSLEGITGSWSPSVVDNQNAGSYTFTPTAGQCAVSITFTVGVDPVVRPTFSFGNSFAICAGSAVPALPTNSDNGISGNWNPAVIDNQNSGTYTFTPTPGTCAASITLLVNVVSNITPTFSFSSNLNICQGSAVPALPVQSTNGVNGSWSPSIIDNFNSGSYAFTPDPGTCAIPVVLSVNVSPVITPTFGFGSTLTICAGAAVPTLPTTSSNGISGSWSPAVVSNHTSATYIFTPASGICAPAISFTVTVNPNIVPVFSFGTGLSLCIGSPAPSLPTVSTNGITGTWSPAIIDDQNSRTYTFTPTSGQCAVVTTLSVSVSSKVLPRFAFGTNASICAGSLPPVLSRTSVNGISGTWSPSVVDNQASATYAFTPAPYECAIPTSLSVTVISNTAPTFSFGSELTICAGDGVPVLPTTSNNGITGRWTPAVVSNRSSGSYYFSPTSGQCILGYSYTVTVNPVITPTFSFGSFQSLCRGADVPALPSISTNGVRGSWTPAVVDNQANGTYTFIPDAEQCANGATYTLEVNDMPFVNVRTDTTIYDGDRMPAMALFATPAGSIAWTNSKPAVGFAPSGTGNIPSFLAVNRTNSPIIATVTTTPFINGCLGPARSYQITVLPLNKDIFIPNVFSPNNDGKNDFLLVYGNYISKVEMRIYNQWGQQIALLDDKKKGWDGRHNGTPQPVGVYVYICKAVLTDGRVINLKGSVTIVR